VCDGGLNLSHVPPPLPTQISALGLDVLVFGEMNSEPLNHLLGFARLAPTQVLFWGNPITSGNPSVDYFVSADGMEHPHRTRLAHEVRRRGSEGDDAGDLVGRRKHRQLIIGVILIFMIMIISSSYQPSSPPFCRCVQADPYYSEQVVLLDGQGIWYSRPPLPARWKDRATLNMGHDHWTVRRRPSSEGMGDGDNVCMRNHVSRGGGRRHE
jgi:hypothetical protein